METVETYLARKYEELELLNRFLSNPICIRPPRSVCEVIERKFHLGAALKAEHALQEWALTETAWAHSGRLHSGPFDFKYDYQRADLEVRGPSFYSTENGADGQVIYAGSGMAAISALLMASASVFTEADIFVGADSYAETIEFIDTYAKHLQRVEIGRSVEKSAPGRSQARILLIDSCTPASAFETTVRSARESFNLIIFDTTCFAGGSGRIGRVLRCARDAMIPIVMVRSHNKLDSLGIEYGRLGSAVFIDSADQISAAKPRLLPRLLEETRKALRLFGGAALPAHFPPYVGGIGYRALTDRRVALMLQNGRRTTRFLSTRLPGLTGELHYSHGLYITLATARPLDEKETRDTAEEMCSDLSRVGLALRHAGSFGFDFGAAEWCRDRSRDRYLVRLAVPDLPTSVWQHTVESVAAWWSAREHRRTSGSECAPKVKAEFLLDDSD
jgi:hypothetical protein